MDENRVLCVSLDHGNPALWISYYSRTSFEQPPLMSGLGGHLWEVSLMAIWLAEEQLGFWLGGRLREVVAQGDSTVFDLTSKYQQHK